MKTNVLTPAGALTGITRTVSPSRIREHRLLSWKTLFSAVSNIRCCLPEPWQDVIPIESVADLKMSVKLIAVLLAAFLLAGIYDMLLLQEGGAL